MSDSAREPSAPTFERTRALAKQLLRACRTGDDAALKRIRAQLPRLAALAPASAAKDIRLADVQHALAREAGLTSWAELRHAIEAREPFFAQLERFLHAVAAGDVATLRRVLQAHPDVARTSLHAACAACDAAAAEAWLARDPSQATAGFGGTSWTPLDCLAASPLFALDAEHAAASVAIAERLLALGASPNQSTPQAGAAPDVRLSVLYRASQNGNAPLVRLLLGRGADPNDGESTYHASERDHREVMELLLEHGGDFSSVHPRWGNTVAYYLVGYAEGHPLSASATSGLRWVLEHGADPNVTSGESRETPLHRVAHLGRASAVAELLLAHGADPRAARADGRTPFDLAVRTGNEPVAALLAARAATNALRPVDALFGACARGDEAGARQVLGEHPGLLESLAESDRHAPIHAAELGQAGAVRVLAALGFDLGLSAPWAATALHQAAWRGHVDLVRDLIALGAPIDPRDAQYGSSPIAWAAHGSANCREADEDYIAIVDLLLAAGAERGASFNCWNEPPEALASDAVAEHLRARGFAPAE